MWAKRVFTRSDIAELIIRCCTLEYFQIINEKPSDRAPFGKLRFVREISFNELSWRRPRIRGIIGNLFNNLGPWWVIQSWFYSNYMNIANKLNHDCKNLWENGIWTILFVFYQNFQKYPPKIFTVITFSSFKFFGLEISWWNFGEFLEKRNGILSVNLLVWT